MESAPSANISKILFSKHKAFLKRCLNCFPAEYQSLDTTRLTLLFFVVSGLDILDAVDELPASRKLELIDWIYNFQLTTKNGKNYPGLQLIFLHQR